MLKGAALLKLGKTDDAIKSLTAALALDSALAGARVERGIAFGVAGKQAESQQDLRKAIEEQPGNLRAILALATSLATSESGLDGGAKLLRDALTKYPDDLDLRLSLAQLLKRKKDYDGALAEIKTVIEKAPKWALPHAALGATYEAAGKTAEAEAEYRRWWS